MSKFDGIEIKNVLGYNESEKIRWEKILASYKTDR